MTKCEKFKEQYESYVLGALVDEERAAIDAHLARRCPTCRREVARALRLVAELGYLTCNTNPPARLRRRVMAILIGRHLL